MMTEEFIEQDHSGRVDKLEHKVDMIDYKLEQRAKSDERQNDTLGKMQETLQDLAVIVKEQSNQRKEIDDLKIGHDANKNWINRMAGFVGAMFLILALVGFIANEKFKQLDQNSSDIHSLQISQGIQKQKLASHMKEALE